MCLKACYCLDGSYEDFDFVLEFWISIQVIDLLSLIDKQYDYCQYFIDNKQKERLSVNSVLEFHHK